MSTPRRRSLRDRNAAAIAAEPAPQEQPDQGEPPQTQEEPSAATTPAEPPPAGEQTQNVAGETSTVLLGIHLHRDEFQAAKAAYLADWQHGGEADTFARWVAGALEAHARRSPAERDEHARDPQQGQGQGRTWSIPVDTVERVREAIAADQQNDRWLSRSGWCAEAISAAVTQARARAGGTLPTPPARLPNRLTR